MNPDNLPETRAARRFRTFFEERGKTEGKLEALHKVLFRVLTARGLAPTDEERAAITACVDADLLDEWTVRAATASSVAEVLRGPARGNVVDG
jgi:hypothetical protein